MRELSKLGLGGHSYMQQLGNDPKPTFEEQCEIVSTCLDNGIRLFDTTYYQERVALGGILKQLGRRDEARIMAWNFFKQPGKEDDLVPYAPYELRHLDMMLGELQTDYIDTSSSTPTTMRIDSAAGWSSPGIGWRAGGRHPGH